MQTLVINNLMSVLTKQGELDSLCLQNVETFLDPYKREEKEQLSFELPETILDVVNLRNRSHRSGFDVRAYDLDCHYMHDRLW